MKDRVVSLATMGYLAAIFFRQGDDEGAMDALDKMACALEMDPEVAHALDPFLVRVGKQMGFDVIFEDAPITEHKPTHTPDKGMH